MASDTVVLHQTLSLRCVRCSEERGKTIMMEAPSDDIRGNVEVVMECPECRLQVGMVVDNYFMA